MNNFDFSIIKGLHNISSNCSFLNDFMYFIADNHLFKGAIIVSLLWFFWFQKDEEITKKRNKIISVLISCLIAICVGRLLAKIFPFRERPVLNINYTAFFPNATVANGLDHNSSMPSDHAVMFFALATGIFLISKRIGVLTFLYVSCFILFPRIYLGYHYTTDVIAGASIGLLITFLYFNSKINQKISGALLAFSSKYPGFFYLIFFLLSFQIGTMFDSCRQLGHYMLTVLKSFL